MKVSSRRELKYIIKCASEDIKESDVDDYLAAKFILSVAYKCGIFTPVRNFNKLINSVETTEYIKIVTDRYIVRKIDVLTSITH